MIESTPENIPKHKKKMEATRCCGSPVQRMMVKPQEPGQPLIDMYRCATCGKVGYIVSSPWPYIVIVACLAIFFVILSVVAGLYESNSIFTDPDSYVYIFGHGSVHALDAIFTFSAIGTAVFGVISLLFACVQFANISLGKKLVKKLEYDSKQELIRNREAEISARRLVRMQPHHDRISRMIESMEKIIAQKQEAKKVRLDHHHARMDVMIKNMEQTATDRQETLDLEAKLARVSELRGMYLDTAFQDWKDRESTKKGKLVK